ncbi:hypothetical protein [Rubrivirga sp. IMCC43871]|uniref:hypothetical protein n=1 Tax=Rubrivirga sp. IMCC43871 TaxID=3391575 RepID=UPI00398FBC9D
MRLLLLTAAAAFALSGCDSTGLDSSCQDCGGQGGYPSGSGHPAGDGSDGSGSGGGGSADGSGGSDGGGTSDANVFIEVDPRQTYLRTSSDHAIDAPALRLADEGIEAGDYVCAVAVGDYVLGTGVRASTLSQPLLTAIFSADDTLGPDDQRVRVKKAVEAGDDVPTPDTQSGGYATDVAQDFDATSVCLTIPEGATYAFLAPFGSSFGSNGPVPDATQPFGLLIKR